MSSPRRLQAGYLMESPLVMADAGILVAMFLLKLPGIPGKVPLVPHLEHPASLMASGRNRVGFNFEDALGQDSHAVYCDVGEAR